jgi:uncharacterized protein YigE (DUF2233 family)
MSSASAFTVTLARVSVLALGLAVVASPFSSTAQAGITSPFKAKSTFDLAPGVEYAVGTMKTTGGRRQSVRVVTVDPSHPEVKLRALLSNDKAVKREKSSATARRKSHVGMDAMAAINGGMAKRNAVNAYAAPLSMHVSNGELMVSQACTWPTIGIDADGDARIANVRVHTEVTIPGLRDPRTIHRVNTHRDDPKVVLFTRKFASSTRTASGGTEVILDLERKVGPSDSQEVTVVKVRRGGGNTELRDGQAVISMKGPNNQWVKDLRAGQRLQLTTRVVRKVNKRCGGTIQEASGWSGVAEALGGNYYTARNGSVAAPTKSAYPSGSQRHPRTGVGVTADGRVLMVTVDGRQSGYSVGVTLKEMGRLMLNLGAKHAFNLDGGGSTAMSRRFTTSGEFKITNRPSDGKERGATNALAAFDYAP